MTESVLLIILLIALAEVINSIKNNRPTASNIGRLFYIRFKTLGLTAFNGFPCVLIIYYAKAMSIFHLNFIWLKMLSGDGTFRHRFFYLNSSLRISSRLLTIAVTISYEPPSEIDFIRAFMFSSKSFGKRVQYFLQS